MSQFELAVADHLEYISLNAVPNSIILIAPHKESIC